jgi:ubiquinone/menaquinone biosynthesis C-methylase UbiE
MSTPVTYRDALMDRYALLYSWLPDDGPLLDVGCGNGIYTSWLSKRAANAPQESNRFAVGIDHNKKNLLWAQGEFPGTRFVAIGGEHLPFRDASFAAVMCTEVLEHTRDDRQTLGEIARVTRPGGSLLLSTPHRGLFGFLDPDNVANRAFETLRKLRIPKPGGGRFYEKFTYNIHRHYSEAQLRSMLGKKWRVEEVYFGGLLAYPLLYGVENLIDAFGKERSYWRDYRLLRTLRAHDFNLQVGKLSYNIALRAVRL